MCKTQGLTILKSLQNIKSEIILDGEQHDEMCSIMENTEAENS